MQLRMGGKNIPTSLVFMPNEQCFPASCILCRQFKILPCWSRCDFFLGLCLENKDTKRNGKKACQLATEFCCCFITTFVCHLDNLSCLKSQLSVCKKGDKNTALSEFLKREILWLGNARRTMWAHWMSCFAQRFREVTFFMLYITHLLMHLLGLFLERTVYVW